MPNSVPSAGTLLLAAARYLEDELLPTVEGYHRFQARVTVNVLRIVERELRLDGPPNEAAAATGHALADAIRAGEIPIDAALAAQLRQGLGEALAINNPKWTHTERPA
jgi:hypothetical protein